MLTAQWRRLTLDFKETAITSRSRMLSKDTYIIKVYDSDMPQTVGWGECPLFRGLSAEDTPEYEDILDKICRELSIGSEFPEISSIRFGFEMALNDLHSGGRQLFFPTPWARGEVKQRINGLIWMGDKDTMLRRIQEKLFAGFKCVKLKIGGIRFDDELDLLRHIRNHFSSDSIELRLDANGAFTPENALQRLEQLARYDIHSIEQPIKAGQWPAMKQIIAHSPIPVALDEELIGFHSDDFKRFLIKELNPRYIILKPALCGGFAQADRWIEIARENGVGWWATSALESDLGLGAIAQWVSRYDPELPQGLGTGQLYINNIPSPIRLSGDRLYYDTDASYNFSSLL